MGQGQSSNANSRVASNAQSNINSMNSTKRNSNAANTMTTPNGMGLAPQAGGKSRKNRKTRKSRKNRKSNR